MTAAITSEPQRRPHAPLWLLALVTFSGTLAMHIFVPALPIAAKSLGAGIGAMQMTVSLYIFGLAVGQLVYGPLADRYGRRPVLLFGLGLYCVAGLAAAVAPEVHSLIAARLFQAVGGCAGLVLGRSIVRDTAEPQEATRRLALMNLMVTIGPSLAPLLGGALATALGWRSIFYALFALGVIGFLFTWRLLRPSMRVSSRATTGSCWPRRPFSASRSAAVAPPRRCMPSSLRRPSSSWTSCTGRRTRRASTSPSWCRACGSAAFSPAI
jgi:DHA1 family bicyclomycin/chloramphenicol resistance-like MFS transporter